MRERERERRKLRSRCNKEEKRGEKRDISGKEGRKEEESSSARRLIQPARRLIQDQSV